MKTGLFHTCKNYKVQYLPKDILSDIIMAAVSIPIAMGYAEVAGLPAVYGLYGSVFPMLLFASFSTAPQFILGGDAAPAAIVGAALATLGIAPASEEAMQFVPMVALFAGVWLLVFYLFHAGKIVDIISPPVMGGFISGIAVTIILMQIPKILGSSSGSGNSTESSTGDGNVSLEAPHASITPKEHNLVTSNVSLVAPGQSDGTINSTGSSQPGTVTTDNSSSSPSGQTTSPSSGSSGSKSYVDILMDAAAQSGVSPYVLAAMILQEQGTNGGTPLISGNYSGYSGYYNFFNVEAYQSGSMSATQMGLRYASQSGSYGRPWNTVEKSILGGAQNYGDNYVKAGQNTFFLKKFNVQGSNPYKHQYMSNVQGAASEAERLSKAYSSLKSSALEFQIPVFINMPAQACSAPTGDGSPNNKLSGLSADGFSLTPSFSKDTTSYNLIVDTSVTSLQISATAADGKASVAGTGNTELTGNSSDITITVTAQNGSTRTYSIHVVRQSGGNTPSGTGSANSSNSSSSSSPASPGGSSGGPGDTGSSQTPGGSNVTIVNVQ